MTIIFNFKKFGNRIFINWRFKFGMPRPGLPNGYPPHARPGGPSFGMSSPSRPPMTAGAPRPYGLPHGYPPSQVILNGLDSQAPDLWFLKIGHVFLSLRIRVKFRVATGWI